MVAGDTVVTVADCERAQTDWYAACARLTGGEDWQDGPLRWIWLPYSGSLMLMFPAEIPPDAVARGVARATELDARIVGAWLDLDVDGTTLGTAGFERGWSPWWMATPIELLGPADDPRISLVEDIPEFTEPADRALLPLVLDRPQHTWHAVARLRGRYAGETWSHLTGSLAGVFHMEVWPQFQRRGLGTGLARSVCAAAAAAGARHAVLNATPVGEKLYSTLGFRRIGDGITWWLHR